MSIFNTLVWITSSFATDADSRLPCADLSYIEDFNPTVNDAQFDTVTAYASRKSPWKVLNPSLKVPDLIDIINPELERTAEGKGMHFFIKTKFSLQLSEKIQGLQCSVLFAEKVTPSFFVDLYELHRTGHDDVEYFYKENIDVEKTESESKNHTLFVMSKVNPQNPNISYDIKWNIRYHSPSAESYYMDVVNFPPNVYITCKYRNTEEKNTNICLDVRTKTNVKIGPYFDHSLALWLPIQHTGGKELVFSWPVGYVPHWAVVTLITLLTTIYGTYVVCKACFIS